jgi:hypothetical protein
MQLTSFIFSYSIYLLYIYLRKFTKKKTTGGRRVDLDLFYFLYNTA